MVNRDLSTIVGRGMAGELRELRKAAGLSVRAVAAKLDWQGSKLSRMETGQQRIRIEDAASLLVIYGVTGADRKRILAMAERAAEPGWWETYGSGLSAWSRTLLQLEAEATAIFNFEPLLVPGLLQTPDYTRALMRSCGISDSDTQQRVATRLGRQAILTRDEPPNVHFVIDEGALRRPLGGRSVMARQLRRMVESAERPNIAVQVVPLAVGGHTGLDGPFMLLDFPRNKPVVHLEHKISGLFLEEPDQIAFYRREIDSLAAMALDPDRSAQLIVDIAAEHERE